MPQGYTTPQTALTQVALQDQRNKNKLSDALAKLQQQVDAQRAKNDQAANTTEKQDKGTSAATAR